MVAAGIVVLLVLVAIVVVTLGCAVLIGVACGERVLGDVCRAITCGCCGTQRPRARPATASASASASTLTIPSTTLLAPRIAVPPYAYPVAYPGTSE